MTPLQARIIYDLNTQPSIDAAEQIRMRIDFLKEYLKASHAKGLVLGISGGQDSSLAGRPSTSSGLSTALLLNSRMLWASRSRTSTRAT